MITKEQIDRINQLARKSKTPEGLTDAEKAESAASAQTVYRCFQSKS